MNKNLSELYKLSSQSTLAGAVLMSLRGRIEWKRGWSNRIGGSFRIPKSVLMVGRAGTGKTSLMRGVFEHLLGGAEGENAILNDSGDLVAMYHPSAGSSTAVGVRETLRQYGNCVHFFDEMSLNSRAHVALIKQIANGQICAQKHGDIQPFTFDGMIIAATNGIRPPPPAEMEDLLATLDRFILVEAKAAPHDAEGYFEAVANPAKRPAPDWGILKAALGSKNRVDLAPQEIEFARSLWSVKSAEILDNDQRAHYRNAKQVLDICLFVKRFAGCEDLSGDEECASFVRAMVRDCVILNPAPLFQMTAAEKAVFGVIVSKDGKATLQDVATRCRSVHGAGNVHRVLNRVMSLGLAYRTAQGHYSHVVPRAAKTKKKRAIDKASVAQ